VNPTHTQTHTDVVYVFAQINGESVAGVNQKEAVSLVRRTGNCVDLIVWR